MATNEQYEFFRSLYDDEEERYGQLEARARFYMAASSAFLAGIFLKAEDVRNSATVLGVAWLLVTLEGVFLAGCMIFVVLGAWIRTYEGVADPRAIIKGFERTPPSNEDFFDHRIVDLAVATSRNSVANDKAARALRAASVCLLGASILLAIMVSSAALSGK